VVCANVPLNVAEEHALRIECHRHYALVGMHRVVGVVNTRIGDRASAQKLPTVELVGWLTN